MVVHIAKADLTMMTVDAVVAPTNSQGLMVGRASLALKERGGETIEQEARTLAPIAVGAAIVTGAGSLYCKAVIHVPVREEPEDPRVSIEDARRATRAALIAAAAHGFDVIAIPGIGTGRGGIVREEAARAMIDEIKNHRAPKPTTVYLVDVSDWMIMAFEDACRQIQSPHT